MVRHRLEADIDLTLFAAADAIDCGAHVVINSTRRHAAKDPEAVPVSVEQHLVGLQQVGSDQKGSAMGQLDMRDLQLRPLAADDGIVLAPNRTGMLRRVGKTEERICHGPPSADQPAIDEQTRRPGHRSR